MNIAVLKGSLKTRIYQTANSTRVTTGIAGIATPEFRSGWQWASLKTSALEKSIPQALLPNGRIWFRSRPPPFLIRFDLLIHSKRAVSISCLSIVQTKRVTYAFALVDVCFAASAATSTVLASKIACADGAIYVNLISAVFFAASVNSVLAISIVIFFLISSTTSHKSLPLTDTSLCLPTPAKYRIFWALRWAHPRVRIRPVH